MNFLAFLRSLIAIDYTQTNRPGWAGRATHFRKARTPFKSSRKREIAQQTMKVEEFIDKDARDARFRELRAAGTRHLNKFSTVRLVTHFKPAGFPAAPQFTPPNRWQSIWCVVRP